MWIVIKAALRVVPKYKGSVALYCLLSLVLIGFGVYQPYLYKQAIDGLVFILSPANSGHESATLLWILLWFGVSYVMHIFDSIKDWIFWHRFSNPTFIDYLHEAYEKMLNFQYDFFVQKKSGELMKVLDDGIEAYSSLINIFFQQLLIPILSFFALLVFAWFQSKELTLACLTIVPIQAFWSYFTYKKTAAHSKKSDQIWTKLFGNLADVVNNIMTTKSFHQEKKELKKTDAVSVQAMAYSAKSHGLWLLFDTLDLNTLAQAFIIIFGYFLIKNGQISVGTLLMFMTILNQLLLPIRLIKGNIQGIQKNTIRYNKFQKMLKEAPLVQLAVDGHSQSKIKGIITFKNVSFAYGNKRKVLSNVNLAILPGEKVAFVGHSGAGKSTMALLLMRFYDVTKGSITLDGVDLRKWDYDNLRSHFGVVWQENILFHDTVLNNIRYSHPQANKEAVIAAAKQAHAHEYIQKFPKGYESIVGDRGIRLSGGEKQRVAIARALIKNPRIVILDEATSALDSITEREVQKGIQNLIADRTAIIIAHRLSTVQHCDKIVVMDQGKIIAVGKHAELLKTNKQYKEMVTLQTNGFFPA